MLWKHPFSNDCVGIACPLGFSCGLCCCWCFSLAPATEKTAVIHNNFFVQKCNQMLKTRSHYFTCKSSLSSHITSFNIFKFIWFYFFLVNCIYVHVSPTMHNIMIITLYAFLRGLHTRISLNRLLWLNYHSPSCITKDLRRLTQRLESYIAGSLWCTSL